MPYLQEKQRSWNLSTSSIPSTIGTCSLDTAMMKSWASRLEQDTLWALCTIICYMSRLMHWLTSVLDAVLG